MVVQISSIIIGSGHNFTLPFLSQNEPPKKSIQVKFKTWLFDLYFFSKLFFHKVDWTDEKEKYAVLRASHLLLSS